ncbi:9043_t:CDS:2 [Funneliformis geosporum]|uniref:9043_t:CDS:1 n=1 Tax=Funneliformis geosporum TaxID=1117311 RepID=A0A9W4T3W7_9GLOM|nr:9043_t:CDS:2 [Funneliformis geosporum]
MTNKELLKQEQQAKIYASQLIKSRSVKPEGEELSFGVQGFWQEMVLTYLKDKALNFVGTTLKELAINHLQDIYQLENSTDLKLLNQAQDKQKELQEALDNIIALLGKKEIKNLKDIRKLLAGKSLKELINTNTLYSQKITDLENSLLDLGKSKLKGKQEYLKLVEQLEQNYKEKEQA